MKREEMKNGGEHDIKLLLVLLSLVLVLFTAFTAYCAVGYFNRTYVFNDDDNYYGRDFRAWDDADISAANDGSMAVYGTGCGSSVLTDNERLWYTGNSRCINITDIADKATVFICG